MKSQLHLDKLQNFYCPLAICGHHHVAVRFPTNRWDKLIDVFLFPITVKERPDGIELELEEMLRESLQNGNHGDFISYKYQATL